MQGLQKLQTVFRLCDSQDIKVARVARLQSFRLHHSQDINLARVAKVQKFQALSFSGTQGCEGSKGSKVSDFTIFRISRLQIYADYSRPLLRNSPSSLIIHVGTNNLKNDDAYTVRNKLLGLKDSIEEQYPNTEVILSTLTKRTDDPILKQKVNKVNSFFARLRSECCQ